MTVWCTFPNKFGGKLLSRWLLEGNPGSLSCIKYSVEAMPRWIFVNRLQAFNIPVPHKTLGYASERNVQLNYQFN